MIMMSKKDYGQYTDYESYTMLSEREIEILKMKNSGMSNSEISEAMKIKKNTVAIYLTRIRQKINGTYQYEKVREYHNSGNRRRMQDPEYREKYNAYYRKYYAENPELRKKKSEYAKEYAKEYAQKNKENIREYQRKYREAHPEKYKYDPVKRAKNKEDINTYRREWYRRKHPKKEAEQEVERELYRDSNRRAEAILRLRNEGKTVSEIAKDYGCSTQNIYGILSAYKKRMEKVQHENP